MRGGRSKTGRLVALWVGLALLVVTIPAGSTTVYEILVSSSADRSGAVSLEGESVAGDVFVFTSPDTGVFEVRFWVDDPSRSGSADKVERAAPFDLAGTNPDDTAIPFDTTSLGDGSHSVTAELVLGDGSVVVVDSTFTVANSAPSLVFSPGSVSFAVDEGGSDSVDVTLDASDGGAASFDLVSDSSWLTAVPSSGTTPGSVTVSVDAAGLAPGTYTGTVTATDSTGTYLGAVLDVSLQVGSGAEVYDLLVSSSADRSGAVSLEGESVAGDVFVFTSPDTGVSEVRFWVDDPSRSGSADKVERAAPFDLAGTNPDDTAIPFDTTSLGDGSHSVTAELVLGDGSVVVVDSTFTVANSAP